MKQLFFDEFSYKWKVCIIQLYNYSILYIVYEKRFFHEIWAFFVPKSKMFISREKRVFRKKYMELNSFKVEFYILFIPWNFYEE